jgi:hypothetical protein
MPKLSVSLSDEVYWLVKKYMEDNQVTKVSQAIASLIKLGSPYEVVVTMQHKSKEK